MLSSAELAGRNLLVPQGVFETPTPALSTQRSTSELLRHVLAVRAGIEPAALSSTGRRSTTELTNHIKSGYEFRSPPIFEAGFRPAREHTRLLVWHRVRDSNPCPLLEEEVSSAS